MGPLGFLVFLAMTGSATAEIVLDCTFENGRAVQIDQNSIGTIWREDERSYPTWHFVDIRRVLTPKTTIFGYGPGIGSPRLDVLATRTAKADPQTANSTAMLSDSYVTKDGSWAVRTTHGQCEWIN